MTFKNKKKHKKWQDYDRGFEPGYDLFAGVHVYRSEDKNAPFSEWERVTEKPTRKTNFTQSRWENDEAKVFYYKFTEVDIFGNESPPYEPTEQHWIRDGKRIKRTPENTPIGLNLYWSTDRNLPLDQWNKMFDKPIPEKSANFKCPVKEPFYMYAKYVNELGNEFGLPSDIQKVIPKP